MGELTQDGIFPVELGPFVSFVGIPSRNQQLDLIGDTAVLRLVLSGKNYCRRWGDSVEGKWRALTDSITRVLEEGEPEDNETSPRTYAGEKMEALIFFPKGSMRLWAKEPKQETEESSGSQLIVVKEAQLNTRESVYDYEFRYEAGRYFHNSEPVSYQTVKEIENKFEDLVKLLEHANLMGEPPFNPQTVMPRGQEEYAIVRVKPPAE